MIISLLILLSFISEPIRQGSEEDKLTSSDINEHFIQLLPSKGLVIHADSFLLGICRIEDLFSSIDTTDVNIEIEIAEPKGMVLSHMSSPPPGYTGEYHPQPNAYFMNYSGNIRIDSLMFYFTYSHTGKDGYNFDTYVDSLTLSHVKVSHKKNAGLFADLKVGDSYQHIFNYYEKPESICNPDIIRKQHTEKGVVFTIGTDTLDSDYYGRIKMIEVNTLTGY